MGRITLKEVGGSDPNESNDLEVRSSKSEDGDDVVLLIEEEDPVNLRRVWVRNLEGDDVVSHTVSDRRQREAVHLDEEVVVQKPRDDV